MLWSRNYRSDSAIPEEYYESDTDFHTSEENISTWFSGSSGLIWLRMGSSVTVGCVQVCDKSVGSFDISFQVGDDGW